MAPNLNGEVSAGAGAGGGEGEGIEVEVPRRQPIRVRRGCCGLPPVRHVKHAAAFQHIPHISMGYRVGFNIKQCLISIFTFHNESINIWSHLLGAAYIIYLLYHFLTGQLILHPMPRAEYYAILTFLISAGVCLTFSTTYHLLGCHSERLFNLLLRADLLGIAILIWGSYVPGIHYAFHCFPGWQGIYQIVTVINLLMGLVGAALTDVQCPRQSAFRTYTFAFLVGFGLVPAIHWAVLVPGHVRMLFLDNLAGMFLCYGLGFLFWHTRFPECLFPKTFDLIFSSHQLWHIFIVMAVYTWYHGIIEYHDALHTQGCELLLINQASG